LLFAPKCGEIFAQWKTPDVFGWDEKLVAGGFFPPAGGVADIDPIGGILASVLVALIFHKGLQQYRLKTIALILVLW
jgi:hypothetical protein